ncbi:Bax inhibitor-1/YccA family protein [Kutzneria kofuensis]|uniref:Putative YccA/Bax inhibitor family protein n=1 Tax=Kutzneria kofuensis TaxID=103725 RepID=A0A7W9KG31_9PSEU|nr:Bax inhibitor-1/YccA family protein [Kutzneria kofuensis]MBB5891760.1 putative YccA/Bax inhibitor family protein [Kutzneria kofuensis]
MRTSSNPAFRALSGKGQGGYAGFGYQGQAQQTGYGYPAAPPTAADRPMTIDDVVTKTAAALGTTVVVGGLTAYVGLAPGFALLAAIVGFALAMVITFKQSTNPALVLAYAAAEGVFLGTITRLIDFLVPGVAVQAVVGTVVVFATMLVLYRTGAVKVTPRLTKWIIGATMGAAALLVLNLLLSFFHLDLGVRGNTPLAIVVSLLFIGIAAFNLLLDFDQADRAIRAGAPARFAWYIAFGLMVTLVWLYIEILNLLAQLQRN